EPSGLRSVPVDPVYPKDHYGRISRACYLAAGVLVFLLVFVDLPLAAGFFLLGLLVAGLVTGRLGPTQQVSFDRVHQVIRHGQWGFFCQHGVDEILALQLLRVPPQGTQKAYYQLNLVSSERDRPRCFLLKDTDYLTALRRAREWATQLRVPLLDHAG